MMGGSESSVKSREGDLASSEIMGQLSRETSQQIIAVVNDIVGAADIDGHLLQLNPAFEKMTGLKVSDCIGLHFRWLIHPDDAEVLEQARLETLSGQRQSVRMELRLKTSSGSYSWIELLAQPCLMPEDNYQFVFIGRSLSENHLIKKELSESRMLLSEAQGLARIGTWCWDVKPDRVSWSDELYKLYGLESGPSSLNFEFYLSRVHPDDRQFVKEQLAEALQSGKPFSFIERILLPNGVVRYLRSRGRPMMGADNEVVRMIGCCQDVTEKIHDKKRLEEANRLLERRVELRTRELETANERMKFLLDVSRTLSKSLDFTTTLKKISELIVPRLAEWSAVYIQSKNTGQIEMLSAMHTDPEKVAWAYELNRRFPVDSTSTTGIAAVIRENAPAIVPVISDDLLGEHVKDLEHFRLIKELGLSSWMCVPVQVHGYVRGAIAFYRIQGQEAFTEEDLQLAIELADRASLAITNAELYAEIKDANRLKDDFLANLSHELRSPMNVISGWTELLKQESKNKEWLEEGLEAIGRNCTAQMSLINDLLDVSRIVTGKIHLKAEPVDLVGILKNVVEGFRLSAQAKGVRIRCEIEDREVCLLGDAGRLYQVFSNLVSNALKFTPSHGEVTIQVFHASSGVKVRVKDSGQGISPSFLPFVFERFRQEDSSTTRTNGGLGLGLAIVKDFVHRHGGEIEALSEGVGKGATFQVTLPVLEVDPSPAVQASTLKAQDRSPSMTSLKGQKVLVIDDSSDALALLKLRLSKEKAQVFTAMTAAEAMQQFSQNHFDSVVSDIGLPGEDGYSLIRRLRKVEQEEKRDPALAVALTGYARPEERRWALEAGFNAHLAKPVNFEALLILLHSLSVHD